MFSFNKEWIENLLSKIELVSLIREYIPNLKRASGRYFAACPFHGEKTPSFSINPIEQYYYCYGCHASGDAITFIMEKENLTFIEALEFLAKKYGVDLPKRSFGNKRSNPAIEKTYLLNREAAFFYHNNLINQNNKALEYFSSRGLSLELIKKFGLGYSQDYEGVKHYLNDKGYSDESIIEAGLINKASLSDNFGRRVIIPIIDSKNRVIAFGGRAIDPNHEPKYKNSTNTVVFDKSRALFNINLVRKLSKSNYSYVLLVEGYIDVIMLNKFGVENVIASMGTAFTEEQAKLIKRYFDKVYICFDGDDAGKKAALSAFPILKKEGLEVFIVDLPKDMDPDDYIMANGKDAFNTLIKNAKPANEYRIDSIANEFDLSSLYHKQQFAVATLDFISSLLPIEQEVAIMYVSNMSGLNVDTLKRSLKTKDVDKKFSAPKRESEPAELQKNNKIDEALAIIFSKFFIESLEFANIDDILDEWVVDTLYFKLKEYIISKKDEKKSIAKLIDLTREFDNKLILSEVNKNKDENSGKHRQQYQESLKYIKNHFFNLELERLNKMYKLEMNKEKKDEIQKQINKLIQSK